MDHNIKKRKTEKGKKKTLLEEEWDKKNVSMFVW